jgi:rhodanese-related sulfurtransferase
MAVIGQAGERWRRIFAWTTILAAVSGSGALVAALWLAPLTDLASVEADVARRWPEVAQLPRSVMSQKLTERQPDVVVFDVREPDEYAVSHMSGAIRVDPSVSRETFLAAHGAVLRGKTAIFYCSVGVRSSDLALRLIDELERIGVKETFNLAGGIFGWHNEVRPLVNAEGATEQVHGYRSRWSGLITRQSLVRLRTWPW